MVYELRLDGYRGQEFEICVDGELVAFNETGHLSFNFAAEYRRRVQRSFLRFRCPDIHRSVFNGAVKAREVPA
jgi:hypothetical protein